MNSLLKNKEESIEKIIALIRDRSGRSPKSLAECIYYIAVGKTTKEAGRCLGLSQSTVEGYILRGRNILQCRNRSELITLILNETD